MAGFGSTIGDMTFNVTRGAVNETLSVQLNNLEHQLIHGRHKGVRFYYNQTGGGSVFQVMTRSLVGGSVSELGNLARNTFKDLLWKDGKGGSSDNPWHKARVDARKREQEQAIKNGGSQYGSFPVNDGANYVYAVDHHGYYCDDALMLGIPLADNKKVRITQEYRKVATTKSGMFIPGYTKETGSSNIYDQQSFESDHLVWFDCSAIVSISSSKNLVITQVQGRDYSRKELVSNGDVNISVSGYITSQFPDIYPFEEVNKLKKILCYKGIVEVNNQILDGWDISKIIIKDFDMPQEEGGKAVQRYSFTAIGVQPSKITEIGDDTAKVITQPFDVEVEEGDKWKDMFEKQLDRLKQSAGSLVDVGLSQGADLLNGTV